ncbi:uncharacterized protein PV09_08879 [Verruconis gallopava]|uniref:Uncharacterized protein n=1 Tax=Verruconis gallopava TaxID=253628 RepID=A0A0D2AKD6_9PEZI|nr:uncharacterized protein PV09_08879 [Verruconis gallopava]KIV99453.1 hypothetical protein PV09_08879 [Verruconis gallopava]
MGQSKQQRAAEHGQDNRSKKQKNKRAKDEGDDDGGGGGGDEASFPLMRLPRELRNRVYEFHLESVYEASRPLSRLREVVDGSAEPSVAALQDVWSAERGAVVYRGYYQPVYHAELRPGDVEEYYWVHGTGWVAREYTTPALLAVAGSRAAREAHECYVERKLLVDLDTVNRFQTWCLDLPDEGIRRIRRLHVACRASYAAPARLRGRLDAATQLTSDRPLFLIRVADASRELVVSALYRPVDHELRVLRRNLATLVAPLLEKGKSSFDGEDVVEALFALHCKTVGERDRIVIGPLKKGIIGWTFVLDEDDVAGIGPLDGRSPQDLIEEIHDRSNLRRQRLFRARIGEGILDS